MNLTSNAVQAQYCGAEAIVSVRFESLNHGGHSHPLLRGFFCVCNSVSLMVDRSGKPSGLLASVTSLSTCFGLPPVIESSVGRYISITEPIMANTPENPSKSSSKINESEISAEINRYVRNKVAWLKHSQEPLARLYRLGFRVVDGGKL